MILFSTPSPQVRLYPLLLVSILLILFQGRTSCIGKQLGLMELRAVASQIVRKYDVSLAPGQDPQAFLDGRRDTFTLALGPLHLVFKPRSQKE